LAPLLRHELAAERGFAHLARTGEEHHFVGQISLHTVIKVAFHTRYFATFLKRFVIWSRLYFKIPNKSRNQGA
jgi:hypothetical protein